MATRSLVANNTPTKSAAASHPIIKNVVANVKSITSTDQIEVWGDGTIWNVTTNAPICVDLVGLTGSPRYKY
jgi:hypothetical protein